MAAGVQSTDFSRVVPSANRELFRTQKHCPTKVGTLNACFQALIALETLVG